jgi:hypothetical protein
MKEQKLTLRQQIAYAHWSAKFAFAFPYFGCVLLLIAFVIYFGLALWFFEPEIRSWEHFTGPHALGKAYICRLSGVLLLMALSYLTVYIIYFIMALLDNDDACRKFFLRQHYHKH